jgi:hypothetical protein
VTLKCADLWFDSTRSHRCVLGSIWTPNAFLFIVSFKQTCLLCNSYPLNFYFFTVFSVVVQEVLNLKTDVFDMHLKCI